MLRCASTTPWQTEIRSSRSSWANRWSRGAQFIEDNALNVKNLDILARRVPGLSSLSGHARGALWVGKKTALVSGKGWVADVAETLLERWCPDPEPGFRLGDLV